MASPTSTFRLSRTLTRTALRRTALPLGLGLGLSTGLVAVHRQQPMRFDSVPVSQTRLRSSGGQEPGRKEFLDADTIKQLSGGSLSGFAAGLLVSVFSKTLVLLAGIGMAVIQIAARNGIDLIGYLRLKDRAKSSPVLAALNRHMAFKLSFALAFALSAFMSFSGE
ncbi:uncharacterized protein B0T15DRAFT_309473 [Chaetomium strumarium]|uniref:Fun14 family protein n=1 Tax=Chaetomium strumarium TaxID=1170767 RepID=A0AAJ0LYM5_9PEZI|nr:hypothetical protein B0T15DRAFT_309473 [Chaetomium strumarium]